tara:strand:- start:1282 stop:1692 length:411 start_codon:yes stop_codon:yes gene_type:complete
MSRNLSFPELMELRYMNVQSGNGFSVDKDLNGYNPTREAYAVGGACDSCECVYNDDLSFNTFKYIMDLKIKFIKDDESRFPNNYQKVIGAWVNDEGNAFIEVSNIVFDRKSAIALGEMRGEEAIWDFKNNCEIKLT